ncbi:polyhydroxyalkanoic acid system family protein [Terrihabitans rhizophilus]|jgi:putative polyhydroxyalkanoate system protein|uniref:Polyhydroxyalkanoic acid system family protein n=1 Tax=Terrihabitans rhizophilus TaxID=3092662 RepID=A0ABU4RK53_9HYPH|nr:polyhydroxyalkanoic acid system family protein [Terrihabitans sp. PJ23]MDX6805223.1 polyhydroxyalkanoic acid system family protein [Terrihabitans sp. PJ23]
MKKPVVVTLPHQHTRGEAVRRIREGLDKAKPQLAAYTSTLEDQWVGDDLHFRMVMMKQEVSGRIHVEDQQVRVEVDLPWILATIAEKVRGQIEKRGSQILLPKK